MLDEDYEFACPYCASPNSLYVDVSGGAHQKILTDCEVCCQPIVIRLELEGDEVVHLEADRENG